MLTPRLEFKWKELTITPGVNVSMQSYQTRLFSMPDAIIQKQNNLLPSLGIVYKRLNIDYFKNIVMPVFTALAP